MSNYIINDRPYSLLSSLDTELYFSKDKNYLFDLDFLGILDVIGDKNKEFLQGQVTCDMNLLSDNNLLNGAICNLQGRILTLFQTLQWQGLKLILPQDLLENTQSSLNKVALLSRVKLERNTTCTLFGYYVNNLQDLTLPQDSELFHCFPLWANFYIIIAQVGVAERLKAPFIALERFKGSLAWHALMLSERQFSIYPKTQGEFLPHRLDLQHTDYISFNKGCYKGQEIIARMHYRAAVKHELRILDIKTEDCVEVGQSIVDSSGKIVGELIDFSPLTSNHYRIAASLLLESPSMGRLINGKCDFDLYP